MFLPVPEFIPPDPVDPMECAWQPPPEPDGPGWWFNPEEYATETGRCHHCGGTGSFDGVETCPSCSGAGDRWWF